MARVEMTLKSILLETSPYEADGGYPIGRDPREISATKFQGAGIEGMPLLKVIRAKCSDCCCGNTGEVRRCVAVNCPLWPYRMGTNPFRSVNLTDEERAKRGERLAAARKKEAAQ